jgi:crotonobetainyl-CoA:carnitine CoA-transferase CaiB-like acyl-CoA transferase
VSGPFGGVRVVEAAAYVFVPAAGAVLADLGADVIKVEPPAGDPLRYVETSMMPTEAEGSFTGPAPYFELANRGKRSVTLDLASKDGRALMGRLLASADVFLTSYLPGVRRRLRLDVDDVRGDNPAIVYCRGSGWGPKGPMRDAGAYDMVAAWCGSGLAHRLTGDSDEPAAMPYAVFDAPGGNVLAGAVATALFKRERTGEPSVVDVSLLNVGWWSMQGDISTAPYTTWRRPRRRAQPQNPLVNSYRTSDGRWLYLCFPRSERDWVTFCGLAGAPALATDERFATEEARLRNVPECVAAVDSIVGARTYADWLRQLDGFSGAWGPQLSALEVHDHPQAAANGYLNDHRCADGSELRLVAPPLQFDEVPTVAAGPAPELGCDTDEILGELGVTSEELADLRASGAV